MTALPIAERELRVASRKPASYWLRVIAAGLALGVMSLYFLTAATGVFGGVGMFGTWLFNILKWIAFGCAGLAGVFLTADCISEEKRDGTLGLLFLTDLRGYDVVLGKLLATSLRAFYGLLAMLPVMAITLLMGGVSWDEFGRTVVLLCHTLVFSLAAGLAISSISRASLKAMSASLWSLLGFFIGLPLLDSAIAEIAGAPFQKIASVFSLGVSFAELGPVPARDFGRCLLLQQLVAWSFLGFACVATPRAWQEKLQSADGGRCKRRWRLCIGNPVKRKARRERLKAQEPLRWLASRDRQAAGWLLVLTLLLVGLFGVLLATGEKAESLFGVFMPVKFLYALVFHLWLGAQASRFFVEGVRTGALELVLVAPVEPARIVRAHWHALLDAFLPSLALFLLLRIGIEGAGIMEMVKQSGATPGTPSMDSYFVAMFCTGLVNFATDAWALAWFSMWAGLSSRKTPTAVLKAMAFVVVLPWIVATFGQAIVMGVTAAVTGGSANMPPFWLGMVTMAACNVAKNVVFVLWSRRQLFNRFHETLARSDAPVPVPPPRPRVAAPPVLP